MKQKKPWERDGMPLTHDLPVRGGMDKGNSMRNPLIAYQQALANPLFDRMFLVMMPTWCQG